MRRGVGPIASMVDAESTRLHPLGTTRGERSLEDAVLDDLQPDVDPRVVEMINDLAQQDRKITMMKIATGCSWTAAATACGAPSPRGEVLRRRLHRHRDALASSTDPRVQATDAISPARLGSVGRLKPAVVHIDGATGLWP
jgi:hypothetical protein